MARTQPMTTLALLGLLSVPAAAQLPPAAQTIVVTGSASGGELRAFDAPYAVGVVSGDTLRAAGPMVNLSEALSRLPGLVASNRNNYAQDLQINSRGFGRRAIAAGRGCRHDSGTLAYRYTNPMAAALPPPGAVQADRFRVGAEISKRALCGTCHLPDYTGQNQIPRLASQHEAYLAVTMKMYRDNPAPGRDTAMSAVLQGLKDADLDHLAHYFAHFGE